MKKTLAAAAVLGAFAGSAIAADVTLYGVIDMGLNYSHVDTDTKAKDIDSFSMESGQLAGSRWGLKGTEDLGNGLTVGFVLENGFSADNGSEGDGPMFDRESMLFVEGGFGKLAFGRIGSFNQGQGSFTKIGMLSPLGTSFGNYSAQAGNVFATTGRLDNSIVYQSPAFAGFQVLAMYSMGKNGEGENESSTDRYYALGATYKNGPLAAYLGVDSINYKTAKLGEGDAIDADDSLTVTLGGSYDFEVVRAYFGAQYFDETKIGNLGGIVDNNASLNPYGASATLFQNLRVKGYSILLGADAPVAGGKLMAAAAYMDAEQSDWTKDFTGAEFDLTRWVVSVGYDYPLSKRTDVYGALSYLNDKFEASQANEKLDWNPSAYTVMLGMRHTF